MKTLLVLSPHPEMAEAVRSGLNPADYRVIHRISAEEAEPLLTHDLAQAVIIDSDFTEVQVVWLVEKLRRQSAHCPILVYTSGMRSEWEEEVLLRGATQVLSKPLRPRALETLLERSFKIRPPAITLQPMFPLRPAPMPVANVPPPPQSLTVLRSFSSLLAHSLNAEAMLRQFLLQLREIISFNRAAIFLRGNSTNDGLGSVPDQIPRLQPRAALGISTDLLENLELSLESGIGRQVFHLGHILRRNAPEALADPEVEKEFDTIGGQVAVPIFDRESLLGLAVFDTRITGETLTNPELELIFHLLEQVGLAVRNIWLHDQLVGNNELLANVLRELNSACVVVGSDLKVLHANRMARKHLRNAPGRSGELEFADLPQELGAKIFQVLRTGAALATFRYEPPSAPGTVFAVTVVPLQKPGGSQTVAALLIMDDQTQSEQLRRLEVEAANLRLVKTMADRLAHEVGNAMVPLSTHQQLLAEKFRDAEFRASLDTALADGVKRVNRLVNQMRFLARDGAISQEPIAMKSLIEEAYQEARKYQPIKATLKYESTLKSPSVSGDRPALRHALAEVLINALQANPTDPKIDVHLSAAENGSGDSMLQIEVRDNGKGFVPEAVRNAASPFYTTRNVGLGLGLAVTRKVLETHHGKLEIVPAAGDHSGIVRISLPLEKASGATN